MDKPTDAVILENMVRSFEQLINDRQINREHIVNSLRHFIAVWKRSKNKSTTPLDKDND